MPPDAWVELFVLAFCVVVSGLASGTETALTSVSRLRVRHLAEEGTRSAAILHRLHQDPSRFLSTVLFVNTLTLIMAASSTTLLGLHFLPPAWGLVGDIALSVLLSIVLLIVSEVTPKTLAIRHAERVALLAAGPIDALAEFLRPILWFITLVSRAITGGRVRRGPYLTEDELMTVLQVSEESGVSEEEEREMIDGIIEIGDKTVREVMIPRTDMVAIEKSAGLQEIVRVFRRQRHTRLPVYERDFDHMVGLIHAKDLLLYLATQDGKPFQVERILRPIKFVPEQKKVDELLHEMRSQRVHMMVVVDEYGGTAGLVTLEDLIEEIVGEIRDEYDALEEDQLMLISDRDALVDASYPMADLNSELSLGIDESGDYDSVGGYVYYMLGTIPEAGASFQGGRARWTVEQVNGRRIKKVRLSATEPWPDEALVGAGMVPPSRDLKTPGDAAEPGDE